MAVELRCDSAAARRFCPGLRRDAAALMRAAGLDRCELSLVLTSDPQIRDLNRDYRGKDKPTDVLSFPQVESPGAPGGPIGVRNAPRMALGDVVISIDTALVQAREFGVTAAQRLRTLLVHGFLHLLGYDHERSRAEARKMFARERELAAALSANSKRKAPKHRRGAAR